ncbi:MAG: LysM peptidoglycan-binding domain-containing protein, partial [Anaerolineales bacterium]
MCGTDLSLGNTGKGAAARGRSLGAPRVTLSLPVLLLLICLLLLAGVGAVFGAMGGIRFAERDTPTPTATITPLPTFTSPPTATETPVPTPTPLPPVSYTVVGGDTCIKIALEHNVSVQSIIELNKLDPNCILSVGVVLQVPQPTYTPTPLPSATLRVEDLAQPTTAVFTYTVHAGDTLQGIANVYNLSVVDLMTENGITDASQIREGQVLIIPLDKVVTPGPTPTPSPPPPYLAANLLVPADGQFFTANDPVTLQWASVGELRTGEFYMVVIEDITCACGNIEKLTTSETKLIVPPELRAADGSWRS